MSFATWGLEMAVLTSEEIEIPVELEDLPAGEDAPTVVSTVRRLQARRRALYHRIALFVVGVGLGVAIVVFGDQGMLVQTTVLPSTRIAMHHGKVLYRQAERAEIFVSEDEAGPETPGVMLVQSAPSITSESWPGLSARVNAGSLKP